jgi:predicted Zn-dependent protease
MRWRLGSIVIALLLAAACETVPVTGRSQIILFSEGEVVQMSDQLHTQFITEARQKGLLVTPSSPEATRQLEMVDRVGRRIIDAAGLADKYKWEITLIRDQQANAFVRPNGKIVVYTGIMPIAKTEAGLAAVLGHEVSHVIARHSAERLTQSMLAQAGVQAANVVAAAFDPAYQAVTAAVVGYGVQYGALLPYSRAHESEADHLGLIHMAKAGYDPVEAIALWQRMDQAGGSRQPQWMSTHPNPSTRIAQLREWLPEAQRYYKDRSLPIPTR